MKKIDLVELASREAEIKTLTDRLEVKPVAKALQFWPDAMLAVGTNLPLFSKLEVAEEE